MAASLGIFHQRAAWVLRLERSTDEGCRDQPGFSQIVYDGLPNALTLVQSFPGAVGHIHSS